MGGHSAGALNYGYETVPDFLFLIKKPFSVIPLRGGCGSQVSRSFSLNYEMFCWPLVVSEARGWESGTMRTQEATGRAQQVLWALSPSLPSCFSSAPHFSQTHYRALTTCQDFCLCHLSRHPQHRCEVRMRMPCL